MAKVPYSKLKLKVDESTSTCVIGELNITVRNYLPIQEKLGLIGRVIQLSHYSNPLKVEIYRTIEMVKAYTDITFTEKQEEDIPKLYDQLISTGAWATIEEAIPKSERDTIYYGTIQAIESIYKYRNSVLGILDTVAADYDNMNFDINQLSSQIANPETMGLMKDILSKMN